MARITVSAVAQDLEGVKGEVALLRTDVADVKTGLAAILAELQAGNRAKVDRPEAVETKVEERTVEAEVPATKALSKGEWKRLRLTKGGVVKAAFAGKTREQAFEAGLCPGFHLPTGERKAAIQAYKAAQA